MRVAPLLFVLVLLVPVGTVAGGNWSDSPADSDIHESGTESDSSDEHPRVTAESVLRVGEAVPESARAHRRSGLNVSYTYRRLPAQSSIVEATMRIPPQSVSETVTVEFDDTFDVVETRNVTRNDTGYEWGGRRTATVTYQLPLDWSYTNNQAESWTLFRHRTPSIQADSAIDVEREIRVEGEGYVGNSTLVMGAHDIYSRQVAGQTLNVIVPDGVSLLYGPNRTADALANASRSLRIGGRDDVVHAFASPEITTPIAAPYPGSAFDDNVMLVDADSELEVWIHEYVHTRGLAGRRFVDTDGLVWLSEGGAQYYGLLLAIQQGYDG